jgi:hypothetical protein
MCYVKSTPKVTVQIPIMSVNHCRFDDFRHETLWDSQSAPAAFPRVSRSPMMSSLPTDSVWLHLPSIGLTWTAIADLQLLFGIWIDRVIWWLSMKQNWKSEVNSPKMGHRGRDNPQNVTFNQSHWRKILAVLKSHVRNSDRFGPIEMNENFTVIIKWMERSGDSKRQQQMNTNDWYQCRLKSIVNVKCSRFECIGRCGQPLTEMKIENCNISFESNTCLDRDNVWFSRTYGRPVWSSVISTEFKSHFSSSQTKFINSCVISVVMPVGHCKHTDDNAAENGWNAPRHRDSLFICLGYPSTGRISPTLDAWTLCRKRWSPKGGRTQFLWQCGRSSVDRKVVKWSDQLRRPML